MRRHLVRDLWFLLFAFAAAFAVGCSPPMTDILANSSEGVGAWDVANARVNGRQLTADVCLQKMDESATISDRLLLQLRNKGYDRIELAMYASDDGQTERRPVVWTNDGGKQMQEPSATSENPCPSVADQAAGHEGEASAEAAGH